MVPRPIRPIGPIRAVGPVRTVGTVLAVGAAHHRLIALKRRSDVSLVALADDARAVLEAARHQRLCLRYNARLCFI